MFKIKSQGFTLFYLFIFLMLLFPTSYQAVRGVLLLLICLQSLAIKKTLIDPFVLQAFIIIELACLLNALYSIIIGNQGAVANISVFLIWPLLYLWFCLKCRSIEVIGNIYKVIIYGGIFVIFVNIVFFINNFTNIAQLNIIAELLGFRYGIFDGYIQFFSPSQSYLPYFLYFSVALLLVPDNKLDISRISLYLMAISSILLILISGRRVMWVIICVLPFFFYCIFSLTRIQSGALKKLIIMCICFVVIIGVVIFIFFDVEFLYREFMTSFDFKNNESNYERTLQFKSITDDFLDNPIIGRGNGYVSNYIRTPDTPWEYELSYNYLLAAFGLLGMTILTVPYLMMMWKCTTLVRNDRHYAYLILPAVSGSIVMLISNATNPYLAKFDFLWCFFLPILILNQIRKTKSRNKGKYNRYYINQIKE